MMSRESKDQAKRDPTAYRDATKIFSTRPRPLDEMKEKALVVLDTNALLVPYGVSAQSLAAIRTTYSTLKEQDRLRIPGQVAREFAKHRATKLAELHKQLTDYRSRLSFKRLGPFAVLESVPGHSDLERTEKELERASDSFAKAIDAVVKHIRDWSWNDPVSLLYEEVFTPETICEPALSPNDVEEDAKRRKEQSIPPGYKDDGHGDVTIWHTMLELGRGEGRDILFVSGDEKTDWWHQSAGGKLYPRFELVEEFAQATGGRSFHIISFSGLLDLFGVQLQVVRDVEREEMSDALIVDLRERLSRTLEEAQMGSSESVEWFTARSRARGETLLPNTRTHVYLTALRDFLFTNYGRANVLDGQRPFDFVMLGPGQQRIGVSSMITAPGTLSVFDIALTIREHIETVRNLPIDTRPDGHWIFVLVDTAVGTPDVIRHVRANVQSYPATVSFATVQDGRLVLLGQL